MRGASELPVVLALCLTVVLHGQLVAFAGRVLGDPALAVAVLAAAFAVTAFRRWSRAPRAHL